MLKTTLFVSMLFCAMAGCEDSGDTRAPTPDSDKGDSPAPDEKQDLPCDKACAVLLAECSSNEPSLALEDCNRECQAQFFAPGEVKCLASLSCNEPGDSCLVP